MENNLNFLNCSEYDAIEFQEKTYKVNKIREILAKLLKKNTGHILESFLQNNGITIDTETWASQGVDCEILKIGSNAWQKGKVKISIEFIPDEIESPLDDVRKEL